MKYNPWIIMTCFMNFSLGVLILFGSFKIESTIIFANNPLLMRYFFGFGLISVGIVLFKEYIEEIKNE